MNKYKKSVTISFEFLAKKVAIKRKAWLLIMKLISKFFGTHSERELKRIIPLVDKIESLKEEMTNLTDVQLQGKTKEFKDRLPQYDLDVK